MRRLLTRRPWARTPQPAPPPRATRRRLKPPAMAMRDPGIYVYGLVADGALASAPQLPGVDGSHEVELVCHGGVCALSSRVELDQFDEQPLREHLSDLAWVEQTAKHHQQVLNAV